MKLFIPLQAYARADARYEGVGGIHFHRMRRSRRNHFISRGE
jgi:hypothetical protein